MAFYFLMIGYDKHQWTNHFLSFVEIICNTNCILQIIPIMSDIALNMSLHGTNCNRLLINFIP